MVTVLIDNKILEVEQGSGAGDQLWISTSEAERIAGISRHPDGFSKDGAILPAPSTNSEDFLRGEEIDLAAVWRKMNKPALSDASGEVWVLGASAGERAAVLQSLQAPDFTLPDLDGRPHSLSDFRGKKVFLVSWASW